VSRKNSCCYSVSVGLKESDFLVHTSPGAGHIQFGEIEYLSSLAHHDDWLCELANFEIKRDERMAVKECLNYLE